jgi:hypothetical protein
MIRLAADRCRWTDERRDERSGERGQERGTRESVTLLPSAIYSPLGLQEALILFANELIFETVRFAVQMRRGEDGGRTSEVERQTERDLEHPKFLQAFLLQVRREYFDPRDATRLE